MQVWALIVESFREAIDRKVFWAMIAISVVVAGMMACVGFNENGVDLLFGTWQVHDPNWAAGSEGGRGLVASLLVNWVVAETIGFVGILLALVSTVSTLPSMMESGTIEILLSKPIGRTKLFIGKYLGAMTFILAQTMVFVGLTFLVVGIRWRVWFWSYWWVVPLMVLLFSYVYCFSAFFAVVTRRSMSALVLTLMAWASIGVVQKAHAVVATQPSLDPSGRWTRTLGAVRTVVPKTHDVQVIAARLLGARPQMELLASTIGATTPEEVQEIEKAREAELAVTGSVHVAGSIGSSLAVEAVVVLLAIWSFRRKDF